MDTVHHQIAATAHPKLQMNGRTETMDEGQQNSWTTRRITRRGVMRRGALGVVGLGLAACNSSTDTSPGAPAPTTAAVPPNTAAAAPSAVAAAPKYGGTLKTMTTTLERGLDPHT